MPPDVCDLPSDDTALTYGFLRWWLAYLGS